MVDDEFGGGDGMPPLLPLFPLGNESFEEDLVSGLFGGLFEARFSNDAFLADTFPCVPAERVGFGELLLRKWGWYAGLGLGCLGGITSTLMSSMSVDGGGADSPFCKK